MKNFYWAINNTTGCKYKCYIEYYEKITDKNIYTAVEMWCDINQKENCIDKYGPIESWDTSNITNMAELFYNKTVFNDDISNWNTQNVTNMYRMFCNAIKFNQNIGGWNMKNVTNMGELFNNQYMNEYAFNKDLSEWDVKNVKQYNYFNKYATNWTNYKYYPNFNYSDLPTDQPTLVSLVLNHIKNWDMTYGPIEIWDTSNITDMSYFFSEAGEEDFSRNINTKQVVRKGYDNYTAWSTQNVTDMTSMFNIRPNTSSKINPGNISNWNTCSVKTMTNMFANSRFNGNISKWCVNTVSNMSEMFANTNFNGNITEWNTSNVSDIQYMFADNNKFNQNISSWNTQSVSEMDYMFYKASEFNQDLRKWEFIATPSHKDYDTGADKWVEDYKPF